MRIAVVAPARGIDAAVAGRIEALAAARFPGLEIAFHPQCFLDEGHFAGSDAARAAALVEAANDPAAAAIWFARGGYGSMRIVAEAMPRLGEAARDKPFLGYSDCGVILAALAAHGLGQPAHGPMAADIRRDGGEEACARALAWLVRQDARALEGSLGAVPAVALNLTILASLIGTPWLPPLAGRVLMIEEVAEPVYRIDRALAQLVASGALAGAAGVRLGRVSEVVQNDPDFGVSPEIVVEGWCARARVAYLGPADIGHDARNMVVPFG